MFAEFYAMAAVAAVFNAKPAARPRPEYPGFHRTTGHANHRTSAFLTTAHLPRTTLSNRGGKKLRSPVTPFSSSKPLALIAVVSRGKCAMRSRRQRHQSRVTSYEPARRGGNSNRQLPIRIPSNCCALNKTGKSNRQKSGHLLTHFAIQLHMPIFTGSIPCR